VRKHCLFFRTWLSTAVDLWFNNLYTNGWTDIRLFEVVPRLAGCSENRVLKKMSVKSADIYENKGGGGGGAKRWW
jgi:hypothetical protein